MINLVVALPAEARPLVDHYALARAQDKTAFPVYQSAAMRLTVSGPGKVAAAAATACLGNHPDATDKAAWLNIGIAGHASQAVGTGLVAHHIRDIANDDHWYPPQLLDHEIPGSCLQTVDLPEQRYRQDSLYDMEAAGYYPTACRFSTSELVQCFKVVSDNPDTPASNITAASCTCLIEAQLDNINRLVTGLEDMALDYNGWHQPHPELKRLTEHWHFTVSEHHQLKQLVRRWSALSPGKQIWNKKLGASSTASDVLRSIEDSLKKAGSLPL